MHSANCFDFHIFSLTAARISSQLSPDARSIFACRGQMNWIILVDWSTSEVSSGQIWNLRDILLNVRSKNQLNDFTTS